MTFSTRALNAYAEVAVRALEAYRRVFPAKEDTFTHPPLAPRDYEWQSVHFCPMCGHRTKHTFIEWLPERVVTATCRPCGFEGTLP